MPRTNTFKQSSSRAMPKPTPEQIQEDKEKGPLEAGQRVKARYLNTRNQWSHHLCQGVVRCISKDGTVAIDYDDNEKAEQVPRNYVHRLEEEQALPPSPLNQTLSGRPLRTPERLHVSTLGGGAPVRE